MMDFARLVAPREHLEVLVEPGGGEIRAALRSSPDEQFATTPMLDTTLGDLRTQLLRELELAGPVVVAGHQPEFVHAGVFAKTLAVHDLAQQTGGTAVFLTVDSDLPKSAHLILPQTTAGGLRRVNVAIPNVDVARPYEEQGVAPREHWLQFFARFASLYEFYDKSLLRTFAYAWLTTDAARPEYVSAMAAARAATEQSLDLESVRELRISTLAQTSVFRAFVAHCALDAEKIVNTYNAAQRAYRKRHRVRAAGRPVPPLAKHGDACELPFWIGRPGSPRRRLFVRSRGDELELLAERQAVSIVRRAKFGSVARHAEPWALEREGWRVRPRALTLSAFARLFLSDMFIHGIGGAKYDEMMEEFIVAALGVPPRPACCVTATLHLPLTAPDVSVDDVRQARQAARDIRFNPQRHLERAPQGLVQQRAELVRRSDELRVQRAPRSERKTVFRELRRVSAQIIETDSWRPAEYDRRVESLQQQLELRRDALDREYFYALHAHETLLRLNQEVRSALAGD